MSQINEGIAGIKDVDEMTSERSGVAEKSTQVDMGTKHLVLSNRMLSEDVHFMHLNNRMLTVWGRFLRVFQATGEMGDNVFTNNSVWKNQSNSGEMGVGVPTNTKPSRKMCRLKRLMNINFSSHDVLKANFNGHATHDGGGGDTSYRGIWCRWFRKAVSS